MKNIFVKILTLALAAAMILSMAGCRKKEDLLTKIKEKGVLELGTEGDWAPWTYHDEDDNLVGFDVEIGTAVAEYLGVEVKFHQTDWDSILAGVDSGRFDAAFNGVAYTEDRAKKYDFSEPYAYVNTVLIVMEDNDEIKSLEDLKGKKTANTISSQYAKIAQEAGAEVTPVGNILETFELLSQGRIDATLNAAVSFNDYMKEHPEAKFKAVATVASEKVVCPARKGKESKAFIAAVNAALDDMRKSGKLAEISNKYFGMDVTQK
ncbi:MAG: transporter substrate-binding domain-containing protein [Lachnospiraceae bacterium]|nr:transporter substrate-binding domain-containing protein [Lachnospiraceae bacterium]